VFAAILLLLTFAPSTYAPFIVAHGSNSRGFLVESAVAAVCLLPHCLQLLANHLRGAAEPSKPANVARYVTVSGTAMGAVTLICLCFYFVSEHFHFLPVFAQVLMPNDKDADFKAFLVGECLWQLSLTSTLFCTLYAVLSALLVAKASSLGDRAASCTPRLYVAACVTCLAFYLISLPLVTNDRMPFLFQHLGCPSVMYFVFAAYAGCVALTSIGIGGSLTCGFNGEEFEIRRPQSCQGRKAAFERRPDEMIVLIPSDFLAVLAATCSLTYLIVLLPQIREVSTRQVTDIIYHLAWSYLRPVYTLLFTMYLLKAKPETAHPVYLALCYFGVLYFGFFCPLADTAMSHRYNKFCDADGNLHSFRTLGIYKHNLVGVSFHLCEGVCFILSFVLFCWSGIKVQAWSPRVEMLVCFGTVAALLVNCISRVVKLMGLFHGHAVTYLFALYYLPGYLVIVCAGLWKMLIHKRLGLRFAEPTLPLCAQDGTGPWAGDSESTEERSDSSSECE